MKRIPIPLYGGLLIVVNDEAAFDIEHRKLVKRAKYVWEDPVVNAAPDGTTVDLMVGDSINILSGYWGKDLSVVCHEAVHCAQAIARHIGMDAVVESEAFAYLTQWFFEQLRSTK